MREERDMLAGDAFGGERLVVPSIAPVLAFWKMEVPVWRTAAVVAAMMRPPPLPHQNNLPSHKRNLRDVSDESTRPASSIHLQETGRGTERLMQCPRDSIKHGGRWTRKSEYECGWTDWGRGGGEVRCKRPLYDVGHCFPGEGGRSRQGRQGRTRQKFFFSFPLV